MLLLEALTERIIGSAIDVHRAIGPGLLESCYDAALAIEFADQGLSFLRQPTVSVGYKGQTVGQFRPDFIVEGQVVVELKCAYRLEPVFRDQVLTYLKASGLKVGPLMNFHAPTMAAGIKRCALFDPGAARDAGSNE